MSTQTPEIATGLEPYREQARDLEQSLAKVKGIQDQTAAITLARDTALSKRQSLVSNWTDTEEESVTELSKLAARAEVFEAKLAAQADQLASAQAELKTALPAFAISYNALFLMLHTFLVRDASSRIAAMFTLRLFRDGGCGHKLTVTRRTRFAWPRLQQLHLIPPTLKPGISERIIRGASRTSVLSVELRRQFIMSDLRRIRLKGVKSDTTSDTRGHASSPPFSRVEATKEQGPRGESPSTRLLSPIK
jgi:hypothetical protein